MPASDYPPFSLYGGKVMPYEIGDHVFITNAGGDFFTLTFGPPNWERMNMADFPLWFHDNDGVWLNCNDLYGGKQRTESMYELNGRHWGIKAAFQMPGWEYKTIEVQTAAPSASDK